MFVPFTIHEMRGEQKGVKSAVAGEVSEEISHGKTPANPDY
jgi:hypothetical protein